MQWKKIFANRISDKGLISKIYKELINSIATKKKKTTKKEENNPKPNNPILKCACVKELNICFSREDI